MARCRACGYDPQRMTEPAVSPSATAQEAWRILLVDDEPTQRLIMARLLKRAGYNVEVAGNGKEALEKIAAGDFQLMITDWEMPEMDGIALCRELRATPGKGYIYTILLTARDAIEHVVTGLQSGADDYLTKPVIEPELIARLSTGRRIVTLERSLRTANEENRRLSITDPLTGAYNREFLLARLPKEIEATIDRDSALSIAMVDVDHFKAVNDLHGHAAGDLALRHIARCLTLALRTEDRVARFGGEEFVVLLPGCGLARAGAEAERLRLGVQAAPLVEGGATVGLSVSIGVAEWAGPVEEVSRLLVRADEALYRAKRLGRNRVESAEPIPSTARPQTA